MRPRISLDAEPFERPVSFGLGASERPSRHYVGEMLAVPGAVSAPCNFHLWIDLHFHSKCSNGSNMRPRISSDAEPLERPVNSASAVLSGRIGIMLEIC